MPDVKSRNDEATLSDRESGKDSSGIDKSAVLQHGKIVELE
jgi:hypothetical protein